MGQSLVYNSNNYGNYTERIRLLRSNGNYLSQRIQCLETSMNKRKQQNQEPIDYEITKLHSMVIKLLQTLAEINVCQHFLLVNEYYNFNDYYYKQMCRRYFQDSMQQFNLRLKLKRQNQRYLIADNNDNDDGVDFLIS